MSTRARRVRFGLLHVVVLDVLLVLGLGGCRSLVEPDAEIRRPPERAISGRVVELNGVPVTYAQITLSNTHYVPRDDLNRSASMSTSGSFSIAVPRDFAGYFDLTVNYLGPFGARSEFYYGRVDTGQPLDLPLDLVPMRGRVEVSAALGSFALAPGELELHRRFTRPPSEFESTQKWWVRIDGTGAIEDLVPRGPWEVWVRTGRRGPLVSIAARVAPEFVSGTLEAVLELAALEIDVRRPENWTTPIPVQLRMASNDEQEVEQHVEIRANTMSVFAAGRWVYPSLSWPVGVASYYALFGPVTAGGFLDTEQGGPVSLVLPPSTLRLQVLDAGVPAGPTDITIREQSHLTSSGADSDDHGQSVYFCENGVYEVKFARGGRTLTRIVVVEGEAELTVDLADAHPLADD